MNAAAWRLPNVIVPVLSSSSTSTSPAASTARPEVAMTFACSMRLIPATPIAESNPPMVVGIRQTNRAIKRGDGDGGSEFRNLHAVERIRQQGGGGEQEYQGQRDQQDGERDLVRGLLALGILDHGDHAVDEGFARVDCDGDHDPIGQHAGAARDGGKIAARLADHGCGLAGDCALVYGRGAFYDFAVCRDVVAGFDQDYVAFAKLVGPHASCVVNAP